MARLVSTFYQGLLFLSCLSMVAAFCTVLLGVVAREVQWDIPGLDAYAGYAIACSLFLALPSTLRQGEHIRVTLVLDRLPATARAVLEWTCLLLGLAIALALAWYAVRLAWVSWTTHDVSSGADATPLWIPQIGMVLGCAGFALAFAQALLMRWNGRQFIASGAEAGRTE
ncbi:TRAP transporter small permease [Hydrogenophaga sp.]|uniref:TRAP transporter small permease n=1 Tax=Hydrogenophaga sp. TaxID=1904254 RepID=UPI003F6F984C